MNGLVVALGGACGALVRYLVGLVPLNASNGFPYKTLIINVVGCILIGAICALAAKHTIDERLVLFLKVGLCGGFTTFSSFALETDQLMAQGHFPAALIYVLVSVCAGVCSVWVGEHLLIA